MSKYLKIVVAALAVAALAAPAFAESTVNGYYRMQMMTDNLTGAPAKDKGAQSQIDNRLRMMYKNTLNEYVYFVYYAEIDTPWGQPSKGSIGNGGQVSADGVNVETKNAYLDFKVPNTIFSFRTGVQGYGDNFDGTVVADDMAGLRAHLSIAPAYGLDLAYFKLFENDKIEWDDVDFYGLQNNIKVNDNLSINADLYWKADASNTALKADNLYVLGAGAKAKVAAVSLEGWIAYEFGKQEVNVGSDANYGALGATAKASMNFGPAKTGLRLTYFSKDDDATDIGNWQQVGAGNFDFVNENLSIFFTDKFYNNTSGGRHAMTDAVYGGYGLAAVNATADFKLPANMYLNTGAGYFMALDDKTNGGVTTKDGKDLGIEIAARVGTKVAEKVDVSLGGAYAFVGSFYKAPGATVDPDNMYKVNFMVNVGF